MQMDMFFGLFWLFFLIPVIAFVVIFIVVITKVCRTGERISSGWVAEAPSFVIPQSHQGRTRSDGSEIKTVRLPDKCPECGAALSQEGIDWVGPLEAKCNYCGATVHARFEDV